MPPSMITSSPPASRPESSSATLIPGSSLAACLPATTHSPAACPSARALALPGAQDLLPQDVGVPAMLSELTQGVQVDPPQRQRSEAVPAEHVIEAEAGGSPAGCLARFAVGAADGLDGVLAGEDEGVGGAGREAHLLTRPPGDGLAEPDLFRVGHVLDQAQQRGPGRDQGAPGLLLGQAVEARAQRGPVLIEERL